MKELEELKSEKIRLEKEIESVSKQIVQLRRNLQ
jgi:predicted  nucleic acid-binding Zn-ribbon protein